MFKILIFLLLRKRTIPPRALILKEAVGFAVSISKTEYCWQPFSNKAMQEACVEGRGNKTPLNNLENPLSIQRLSNSKAMQQGFRVTQMSKLTIEKLVVPKTAERCFLFPAPWE